MMVLLRVFVLFPSRLLYRLRRSSGGFAMLAAIRRASAIGSRSATSLMLEITKRACGPRSRTFKTRFFVVQHLKGLPEATEALSEQTVDVSPAVSNHLLAVATLYDFYPASEQGRQVRRLRRDIRRPLRTGKCRPRPRDCEASIILRRVYNSRNGNGHPFPP